jgi:hypothetical protein
MEWLRLNIRTNFDMVPPESFTVVETAAHSLVRDQGSVALVLLVLPEITYSVLPCTLNALRALHVVDYTFNEGFESHFRTMPICSVRKSRTAMVSSRLTVGRTHALSFGVS